MSVPVVNPNDSADEPVVVETPEGVESSDNSSKVITLTQEELDRIVKNRLARDRAKHELELEEVKSSVGKTEIEVAAARAEKAELQASIIAKQLNETIVRSTAVEAAYGLDVRPEKINAVLKLAELPSVDSDGDVDAKAVNAAIANVLKENPEWVRVKGSGTPVGAGDRQQVPVVETPKSINEAVAKFYSSK